MAKYKFGDVEFGSIEDKHAWIIDGVIMTLDYIGKESTLSPTEKDLRNLAIRRLKNLKKSILK